MFSKRRRRTRLWRTVSGAHASFVERYDLSRMHVAQVSGANEIHGARF